MKLKRQVEQDKVVWFDETGSRVATFWPDSRGFGRHRAAEAAWLVHLTGLDIEPGEITVEDDGIVRTIAEYLAE